MVSAKPVLAHPAHSALPRALFSDPGVLEEPRLTHPPPRRPVPPRTVARRLRAGYQQARRLHHHVLALKGPEEGDPTRQRRPGPWHRLATTGRALPRARRAKVARQPAGPVPLEAHGRDPGLGAARPRGRQLRLASPRGPADGEWPCPLHTLCLSLSLATPHQHQPAHPAPACQISLLSFSPTPNLP